MKLKINLLLYSTAIIMLHSCSSCNTNKTSSEVKPLTEKERTDRLIEYNKALLKAERQAINKFIEGNELSMDSTGSGLRYFIYQKSDSDKKPIEGNRVSIKYTSQLLSGEKLYSSEIDGLKSIHINKDNNELGLHEGLQLLSLGEKAKFILPSHLAFGVHGDNNKIPSRATIIYDVELVEIN